MKHIASWTQTSTAHETIQCITELALSHCREGGTEGEIIATFIRSGDYLSLCGYQLSYDQLSVHNALHCRQALAYFTKLRDLPLGIDKRAVALDKMMQAEAACLETNALFKCRRQGTISLEPWVESVLYRAQQKIARVLGRCPTLEELKYRFGPGATTITRKSDASVVEKLQAGISCSEDLLPYASKVLEQLPALVELHQVEPLENESFDEWEDQLCDEEEGQLEYENQRTYYQRVHVPIILTNDEVHFVQKDAKTDRSITVGGSLNLMVQLAYGDLMSRLLRAAGIDLKDQTRNQKLAQLGSLDGSYATLDLTSASDTVSTEVVYELLPIDWALALDVCRSKKACLPDGSVLELERFSSMGNGYTFPLESLIFWALSSSASLDDFASVYGDDIIVSTGSVERVMHVLHVFGFQLNKKKSYWTGPFRESCGADFHSGLDIRPVYQKDLISPKELFRLHNFYVRHGDPERAQMVKNYLNPSLIIYGPDNYGDGHLLGDWRRIAHKRATSHGYAGVLFDTFKECGRRDARPFRPGDRVLPSYSIYARGNEQDATLNSAVTLRSKGLNTPNDLSLADFERALVSIEPIPERKSPVDGEVRKTPSLPGTDGYKRVSIYTFE